MSDLQILLIALGALIIAGVVFYNWWQEKKLRNNITEEFIVPQKDVLVDEFYIDADELLDRELAGVTQKNKILEKLNDGSQTTGLSPELKPTKQNIEDFEEQHADAVEKPDPIVKAETIKDESVRNEPFIEESNFDKLDVSQSAESKNLTPNEPVIRVSPLPNEIHPQIDLTAFLFASKSISIQDLNAKASAIISEMSVPIMIHALDENDRWHLVDQLSANESFKQFSCSMQMADRSGPVPKSTLNKFQFSVEHLGLELNAHVEWQGAGDAILRAVDLDKFCIEVDQLVSVHLLFDETPAHGTKFKGLAEANGLQLSSQGNFCYFANGISDHAQFVLFNKDNQLFTADNLRSNVVKGATFQLEIPKVTNCEQVFNQMINVAQKMSTTLNARMVDDNQKALGDLQIEKIRQQLKIIHARMVARGIMPGSASSMRLFN